jgi:Tol biopolymer transport system component
MRLTAGDRLGSYEIVATLGAGGMGEVYRARDTRLGREVAIKVLPAERLVDEGRKRRFVQEARAASALNHPSIVTIHEIESSNGSDFIVMEYVPGQTLDGLIPKHGMPVRQALRVAIPIADALIAAHSRGVVHRDLKPANVIVTREGVVKVLDFGLAKLTHEMDDPGETLTTTTSGSGALTRPGLVTGTAGYMSPEQATGGRVDARSDIFSFGAVLYEMVTGRRAFSGKTLQDTLTKVVTEQPTAPTELVREIPEALERLILRCLRKEVDRRFQHMSDLKVELQELKDYFDPAAVPDAARPVRKSRAAWGIAGVAALLASAVGAAWLWRSAAARVLPAQVVPLTTLLGWQGTPAFSPDGERVAFYWNGESDNYDIYVKLIGASELHRLTADPALDIAPAWSPDGRRIAFTRSSWWGKAATIHLVSALGGPDRKLSDLSVCTGFTLSWTPDGKWIAAARACSPGARGIYLFPVDGGEPRPLTQAPPGGVHRAPAVSPDGRFLAFAACVVGSCDMQLVELGPDFVPKSSPRRLTRQGFSILAAAWVPDGRSLVYDTEFGPGTDVFQLWRVAIDGSRPPERLELAGLGARWPALSGNRLAFTRLRAEQDLVRLTPGRPSEVFPASSSYWDGAAAFSPDGRLVAFESMRSGERIEIWLSAADGKNPVQLTRGPGLWQGSPAWSPDGRRVAFDSQGEDRRWDIWTIDVAGGGPQRLTQNPGNENVPTWSRDGRWVYYSSEREGKGGIWRIPAGGGAEERVAGLDVTWVRAEESLDRKTLFVGGGRLGSPLFAVPLAGGPARKLLDCVAGHSFAVAEGGLYYAACGRGSDTQLRLLQPDTGRDSVVGTLEKFRFRMTASADGRTFLYASETRSGSDLMLVEGFR